MTAALAIWSFAAGAIIASFLNVVIWRVPRGESIVRPGSHCPQCGAAIRWWQNVPILSYLALRGRCASCKCRISARYPAVELLGGILFCAAYLKFNPLALPAREQAAATVLLVAAWIWIALMIAGSFIDFDHLLLPDFTTVGGMVLGLGANAVLSLMRHTPAPIVSSAAGLATGFGILWAVRFAGSKIARREAMGMGDVFLLGAVGAMFGPVAAAATLILSSVAGSIAGMAMVALSKIRLGEMKPIPYGPYICLGCAVWIFCGERLLGWYMGLLGAGH